MLSRGTTIKHLRISLLVPQSALKKQRLPWMAAGRSRYASSSFQSNDDGSGMDEKSTDTASQKSAVPSRMDAESTAKDASNDIVHPFMPVVNMPENEFAHHSFFALYRPLLGLSAGDEKPFYSHSTQNLEEDDDEALATYMMDLQPFEPPNIDVDDDKTTTPTVTFSIEDDQSVHQLDQSMPMYYMPEGEDVVDYLAAMQEQMKRRHALEDQEENPLKQSKKLSRTRPKSSRDK